MITFILVALCSVGYGVMCTLEWCECLDYAVELKKIRFLKERGPIALCSSPGSHIRLVLLIMHHSG